MKTENEAGLKEKFSSLKLGKAYFFSGSDSWRKNSLVKILENSPVYKGNPFDFLFKEADGKTLSSFLLDCDSPPLQSEKKIAVLKNAQRLKTAELKDLFSYASGTPDFLCLIVLYNETLKKNDPLIAELDGTDFVHCCFEELDRNEAIAFVIDKFKGRKIYISEENASLLYELTGGDSARLEFEAEKISIYLKEGSEVSQDDIRACSSIEKEENPYEIIDAVTAGDGDRLVEITEKLISSNAEPMAVLSVFSAAAEKILKMAVMREEGLSHDFKLAYSIGIFYRELNNFNRGRVISSEKAARILSRCAEAENLLKTSSGRDPGILLKNIAYELKKAL